MKNNIGDLSREETKINRWAFALMDEMFRIGKEGVPNPERREFILRRMMELDAQYPSANWAVEADKLRMAWAAQDEGAKEHADVCGRLGRPGRVENNS